MESSGSIDLPFKLGIVGGGPAGMSILVRAIRLGVFETLVEGSDKEAGVILVDSSTEQRFGGGKLQDYCISSNTWGNKFYTNVVEEKLDALPAESIANSSLECLIKEGNYFSSAGKDLLEGGAREAPLKTVGRFLVDVACCVSRSMRGHTSSSMVLHETKVVSIQRALRPTDGCSLWKVLTEREGSEVKHAYYCSYVALATGGKQCRPDLGSKSLNNKLLMSDHVCTSAGIAELRRKLLKHGPGTLNKKRIVIVGGSHSAFSAAWMCLHQLGLTREDVAAHGQLGANNIVILHRSDIRVFYPTKKEADKDRYENVGVINSTTGQIHPFGGLRGDSKALWRDCVNGHEPRVRIVKSAGGNFVSKLYDEAAVIVWACGYETNCIPVLDTDGTPVELSTDRGQIAVDEEARMTTARFIKGISVASSTPPEEASAPGSQADAPPSANAAEQCGGEEKPKLKSPASSASSSPSKRASTTLNGGKALGCMNAGDLSPLRGSKQQPRGAAPPAPPVYPVEGLLGLGLGYGLKATLDGSDKLDGSTGRADGVAVYVKRAATLVLAQVLGPKVFGVRPQEDHQVDDQPEPARGRDAAALSEPVQGEPHFISSWDERATIMNERKWRQQRHEREEKEEKEKEEKEKERAARREARLRKEEKEEEKERGSPVRQRPVKGRTACTPTAPSFGSDEEKSAEPLKFPAIFGTGGSSKTSKTSSSGGCEGGNKSPGWREKKERDTECGGMSRRVPLKSELIKRESGFRAGGGGGGALSSTTIYTMSNEFKKKLSKTIDESKVSNCIERLSRPRGMGPVTSPPSTRGNRVKVTNESPERHVVPIKSAFVGLTKAAMPGVEGQRMV